MSKSFKTVKESLKESQSEDAQEEHEKEGKEEGESGRDSEEKKMEVTWQFLKTKQNKTRIEAATSDSNPPRPGWNPSQGRLKN